MFTSRLTIPEPNNPYYNRQPIGYNPCRTGNFPPKAPDKEKSGMLGLDTLPNCVGYVTGRFNEIAGEPRCKYLGNTNAKHFIALAKRQGLEITEEPTIGGVMVWDNGKEGHVAVVEEIAKSYIRTSESEWSGKAFATYRRTKGKGHWIDGCYWMGTGYKYIGCIKNPAATKEEEMSYEQFKEYMSKYIADLKTKPADPHAAEALEWAKNTGLMTGNLEGNLMPKAFIERQDVAVMLHKLHKK